MAAFDDPYVTTDPLGSADANTLDNIIRELKSAIDQRIALEHQSFETGADETTSSTAMGRHIPGKVGCLFYGTEAQLAALTGMGEGAIGYETDTQNFKFYQAAGGWSTLSWNSDDIVADNETLEIAAGSPGVLGMKHDNQQWTETAVLLDVASIETDCDASNSFSVTLGGNRTLANPDTGTQKAGATYVWLITQDGTGSRTLAYGSEFKWPGGVAPILTTAAGAVDIITCISTGTALLCSIIYDIK